MKCPLRNIVALALAGLVFGCSETKLSQLPPQETVSAKSDLRLEPYPLDFGGVVVDCPRELAFTLRNVGDAGVTVRDFSMAGLDADSFFLGVTPPFTVPAQTAISVPATFVPSELRDYQSSVSFLTNEPDDPRVSGRLLGEGVDFSTAPVDLVLVIDVSTTMSTVMPQLHGAINDLFDVIDNLEHDTTLGLVTFVNDVIVHRNGANLDRETFFNELESQLNAALIPNGSLPRNLTNSDMPENSLDGIYRAIEDYDWRPETRRNMLLLTDNTFYEPPATYSGGVPAAVSWMEVRDAVLSASVAFHSVNEFNYNLGRGFSHDYDASEIGLTLLTGGSAFKITEVASGATPIDDIVLDIVGDRCPGS